MLQTSKIEILVAIFFGFFETIFHFIEFLWILLQDSFNKLQYPQHHKCLRINCYDDAEIIFLQDEIVLWRWSCDPSFSYGLL